MSYDAPAAPLPTGTGQRVPCAGEDTRGWRTNEAGFAALAPDQADSLRTRMAELYQVRARSIPDVGGAARATRTMVNP